MSIKKRNVFIIIILAILIVILFLFGKYILSNNNVVVRGDNITKKVENNDQNKNDIKTILGNLNGKVEVNNNLPIKQNINTKTKKVKMLFFGTGNRLVVSKH